MTRSSQHKFIFPSSPNRKMGSVESRWTTSRADLLTIPERWGQNIRGNVLTGHAEGAWERPPRALPASSAEVTLWGATTGPAPGATRVRARGVRRWHPAHRYPDETGWFH